MAKFEFVIVASSDRSPDEDDFFDCFYDAGCDDATVSLQKGRITVDFAREADSIDEAIATAIECVRRAGAVVERVEPDPLVNLTDIAERVGVTRAALSNYARGERRDGFPLPVARVTTSAPLWDWADVAAWFYRHDQLPKEAVLEALAVKTANAVIDETLKERTQVAKAQLERT